MSLNENCACCKFFIEVADPRSKAGQALCYRYPPTVGVMIAQGVAGPQPVGVSMYPSVTKSSRICGEFVFNEKTKPLPAVK